MLHYATFSPRRTSILLVFARGVNLLAAVRTLLLAAKFCTLVAFKLWRKHISERYEDMTTATDFTPEEAELLFTLPFVVAGTSLATIHVGAIKAVKTAFSLYFIVRDTSRQFPESELIQTLFALKDERQMTHKESSDQYEGHGKEAALQLRNDMCERALGTLNERCQPQEIEEYKRWLWQIASEVMQKAHSHGFLGLGKKQAEAEIAQALQDFAFVLQLPE